METQKKVRQTVLHKAEERIINDFGWLRIKASFREDAVRGDQKKFGSLVILDDAIMIPGGRGFNLHPHDNMEVISYITSGTDRHTDSRNGVRLLQAGDIQLMSAGTGIEHSDGNDSDTEPLYMFQIWILPEKKDIAPRYQYASLKGVDFRNKFHTFITPEGDEGSLQINQRAYFSITQLDEQIEIEYPAHQKENGVYVFVLSGQIQLQDMILNSRDAIGIPAYGFFTLKALDNAEVLLIEMPVD